MLSSLNINDECESLINLFCKNAKQDSKVDSVILIGSVAKSISTEISDIDLLLLTFSDISFFEFTEYILAIDKALQPQISDDIYTVIVKNTRVRFSIRDVEEFSLYINQMISGKHSDMFIKPWVIGGVIPEVIFMDINACLVLFDKSGIIESLIDVFKSGYPQKFRIRMIQSLFNYIKEKTELILLTENLLLQKMGSFEIFVQFTRLIYIYSSKYNPGLKHILHSPIKNKMDDSIVKVSDILNSLYTKKQIEAYLSMVNQLIDEVRKLETADHAPTLM